MIQKTETKEPRESTSLKIKPSVWKNAKLVAVKHDRQLSDIVEEALEEWIVRHDIVEKEDRDISDVLDDLAEQRKKEKSKMTKRR